MHIFLNRVLLAQYFIFSMDATTPVSDSVNRVTVQKFPIKNEEETVSCTSKKNNLKRKKLNLLCLYIVYWSVLLVELTVSWEENMEVAHERKLTQCNPLWMDIERKGRRCKVLPFEMGCRGYAFRALIAYLRGIGLSASELKIRPKNWKP